MDVTGRFRIPARRDAVWRALNDTQVLRDCIPGCTRIGWTSPTTLSAAITQKIGPWDIGFDVEILLTNVDPPSSYTISARGLGGVAGFAGGQADVQLSEDGPDTILAYAAHGKVEGKLARLGGRILGGAARKIAQRFFDRFQERLADFA